ncbi:glutamate/aspartate ABC transporter, periplasmic glutamate/aspartate-binding domain protein [Burkholderia thailandensis]|uniref:Glutamate/aspartate ABC transporter, periplasmic glutamate/aspartate-binding domain protein n=1 Tax=Burkholderia thailandensis TaxID=57975 RepID=A0AAW9D001_BURTH|nr:glutamate/aspartate ABC transporter, periplasmic glutamate/aspartate-binding domain protein [Burkholderia thailandensis]
MVNYHYFHKNYFDKLARVFAKEMTTMMKFPKAMLMVAALSTFAGGAIAQETGTLKKSRTRA